MKGKKLFSVLTALTMLPTVGMLAPAVTAEAAEATTVLLNPADASPFNNGRFEGWGTSLCWWANRLGYSEKLTQAAADAFFSENGLGLDIARYNLGGGDDPSHNHINRSDSKVPGVWKSFELSADGKDVNITEYDLSKDQNQLNIAKAALKANPNLYFEGFSNSAPYFMTVTGCTGGGNPASSDNLKPDMYDDFGKFIAEATKLFKNEGIKFESYSPMNEPDTNYWGVNSPKQEGCHFDPGESQSKAIIETRKALDAAGLTDVIVAGMDETNIDSSVANVDKLSAEARAALGRLDTHTYSGSKRAQLKAKAQEIGKTLWMSEVDKGGDGATLANMIITDMNGMQPAAWVMWDIIDLHKDSDFVDPTTGNKTEAKNSLAYTGSVWGVGMANHDDETLFLSNRYYAYGQFTKYINPGDTIIASSGNTLAAYNKESGDIKIVANNTSSTDQNYVFDLSGFANVGTTVKEIRTDMAGNEKWKEIEGGAELNGKSLTTTLKGNTVTTYVISGNAPIEHYAVIAGNTKVDRGSSVTLTVDTNMTGDKVWSVDNTEIAEITADGVLTAKNPGKVNVSVKIGDYSAVREFEVTVHGAIKGAPSSMKAGQTASLTADTNAEGDIKWSVDNTEIAEITADGVLTAKAPGTVTVTMTVGTTISVSKTIKVTLYTLSGTPSWGDTKTAPADNADYTHAADGDLNTYFDGTTGGWVQYDYGTPYKISSVRLAARTGNGMADRTKGAKIQGSNDGIGWTDLYTVSAAIAAGSYTTIEASQLANNYAYRYFRYINTENMANIAEFIIDAQPSDDVASGEPKVTDIDGFTDDFEGSNNIFGAAGGDLSADGNQVYTTKLARYGNVFVPAKATATAEIQPVTLTGKDKLRLTYDMFCGWENSGKDNTLSLKDADGNELVGYTITGGGYNLNQLRIGGVDLLAGLSEKPVIQCKTNASKGANRWNHASQPFANNMGLNKHVELIIDGTGAVTISLNGGIADLSYSGTLTAPVSVKTLELTGSYNSARDNVVSYDNLDADLITYQGALATPSPTPQPTEPPVIPENGELIHMDFDNGDLTSTSAYGKAEGTPKFVEVDGRKCIQFDGTAATVVNLKDANGNALLTGQEELTISFKVKPTANGTSWWFFAAPNASAQNYENEQYLGAMTNGGTMTVERYKNSGSRLPVVTGVYNANEWNDVTITAAKDGTSLYINGVMTEQTSSVSLTDLLGKSSVAYIGLANWGSGEYATGYLDDFVIKSGVEAPPTITMPDLSAVRSDIALPAAADDGSAITWTSDTPEVIANDGKVTRPDGGKVKVTLTATVTKNEKTYTTEYTAVVIGLTAAADTFTAYADGNTIRFSSEYDAADTPYTMYIAAHNADGTLAGIAINKAEGSFENLTEGSYKVSCYFWDNMAPKRGSVTRTVKVKTEPEMGAYLFAHFVGTESNENCEQIYFSLSTDGTTWKTVNSGNPVLVSNVGEKGVRDPYILRGEDGKFFVIATDLSIYNLGKTQGSNKWGYSQTNGSKSIVIWESDDLVNWSEARLVKVAVDNAGCTWAPEAVYDPEKDAYMVFWASKTAEDNYSTQRMYRSYTKDFVTFTEPEIYIDGGKISNIDTTITSYKGMYYRFTKNESKSSVTMMKCPSLSGEWEDVAEYTLNGTAGNTVTGYEGPTVYKLNGEDKWCLLLDYYSKSQGYKPFVTDDISKGSFTSASDFTMDATYRHGTVMPITMEEYNALTAKYNAE